MKKIISLISLVVLLASCWGNTTIVENTPPKKTETPSVEKIKISTSLVPLASVINSVGWEYVEVNTIIPPGVSPHWFDLSPKQMQEIADSEIIFIVWSLWIDDFLEKIDVPGKMVPLSTWLTFLSSEAHDHHDEDGYEWEEGHSEDEHEWEEHHDEDKHEWEEHEWEEYNIDPHVWLGNQNIRMISQSIQAELEALLPEQAEYFAENTLAFQTDVEKIFTDFAAQNEQLQAKEFIVFHDAYNYLLDSASIPIDNKIIFSPNAIQEIGTAHMGDLIDEIEIHWVKHIFSEPQFSSDTITNFAEQYSLELTTLDPIGTDDSVSWYVANLKMNLEKLQSIYE